MQERQDWLSDYLRRSGFDKVDYVGIFSPQNDIQEVSDRIRGILNLSHNWAFEYSKIDDALKYITSKREVLLLVITVLLALIIPVHCL